MSSVLIFGEVLFDCFEDGSCNLGGAPFNVAWHLQGLGINAQLLSRIGQDELGNEIQAAMQEWGLSLNTLQVDPEHNTGTVSVKLKGSIPTFDIVLDSAYDFIEFPDGANLSNNKLLYHGSLALRSKTSRDCLLKIRKQTDLPVFIDINLRPPHWDKTIATQVLKGASWVKLNHEELIELSDVNVSDLTELAKRFFEQYQLDALIVTEGEDGAFIISNDGMVSQKPYPVTTMVDTVGAGDAFSAMTITGLLQGWEYKKILDAASAFASRVCELRGAVTNERAFYDEALDEIV